MSSPFIAEIRIFAFNFAPRGWAMCNGQLLPINQNQALFSLLGTSYGGNGQTNFALPDLRSRVAAGFNNSLFLGSQVGIETVTLSVSQMPTHTHNAVATNNAASSDNPQNQTWAKDGTGAVTGYAPSTGSLVNMAASAITNTGGGQAHSNVQPYLVLNFCIALQGNFPSRN